MWLFFALLNPLIFATTHFTDKYLIDKKVRDPWLVTVLGGFFALAISCTIMLFHGFHLVSLSQVILLIAAGFALTYYLIPYYSALALDDTSNVTPLFQFVSPITLVLSYIFLKEHLTRQEFFAFILLFGGGLFLAVKTSEEGLFRVRKSFWLMLLASLIAASSAIFFKFVSITVDFWTTMIYVNIGISIASFSLLLKPTLRKGFIQEIKRISLSVWMLIAIGEILNIAAEIVLLFAFSLAPVSLVNAIGGIQPLYVLFLGTCLSLFFPHILKENLGKKTFIQKSIAIGMLIIGIYFLYI